MDWQQIAPYSGLLVPLLGALLAWLNRQWFFQMLVPKMVLVAENQGLKRAVDQLSRTNAALIAQATGWKGAADSAEYTRREAAELRERVSTLESEHEKEKQENLHLRAKLQISFDHIQALYAFIAAQEISVNRIPPALPSALKRDSV